VLPLRETAALYVVVWLGDDPNEEDGDPLVDGGDADANGRLMLLSRAEAFGPRGARRAVEAVLRRVCVDVTDLATCRPGIRVQSWRMLNGALP
jgi:hypothetical protein